MTPEPAQPTRPLEYRPDQPAEVWRDPLFALVPYSVGAFCGGGAGTFPAIFSERDFSPADIFCAIAIAGVFVFAVAVTSFGLTLALRCKLSRHVLIARQNMTCFIAGLCTGAITCLIGYLIHDRWSFRPPTELYMFMLPPCLGAIIASFALVRSLRIKTPPQ